MDIGRKTTDQVKKPDDAPTSSLSKSPTAQVMEDPVTDAAIVAATDDIFNRIKPDLCEQKPPKKYTFLSSLCCGALFSKKVSAETNDSYNEPYPSYDFIEEEEKRVTLKPGS